MFGVSKKFSGGAVTAAKPFSHSRGAVTTKQKDVVRDVKEKERERRASLRKGEREKGRKGEREKGRKGEREKGRKGEREEGRWRKGDGDGEREQVAKCQSANTTAR